MNIHSPWDITGNFSKNYTYGTHRSCDPDTTLSRLMPCLQSLGITRVANITGLDYIGIPVCLCVRPQSRSLTVSQGKGLTLSQARVSAIMESIEIHHAQNHNLNIVQSSYRSIMEKGTAVDPETLNLRSNTLYHKDLPVAWVRGFDLVRNKATYIPYDLVHCNYVHEILRPHCFISSTNGLSSGNNLFEAVSHGICEVIERDARAQFLCNPAVQSNPDQHFIDIGTIESQPCRDILSKLDDAGVDVFIWNETSDVGIPVIGCSISDRKAAGFSHAIVDIFYSGFGCHLSKEIALLRAVTEAVQTRLTRISGSRDDLLRTSHSRTLSEDSKRSVREFYYSLRPSLSFTDLPSLETDSFDKDVRKQLSCLQKRGFEQVVITNLTQPEIDVSVVRVVIPGMSVNFHGEEIAARTLTVPEKNSAQ